MPKTTRKFPTDQKTTTVQGNRDYRRLQQKEFRKKKKADDKLKDNVLAKAHFPNSSDLLKKRLVENQTFIEAIKGIPDFKELSVEKQEKLEKSMFAILSAFDAQLDDVELETRHYFKIKADAVFDLAMFTLKRAEKFKQSIKTQEVKKE